MRPTGWALFNVSSRAWPSMQLRHELNGGRTGLKAFGLVALGVVTPAVFAQEVAPATGEGGTLQEVIVTAQKQSQNIQEVPLSITAVTGSDLERSGVRDISDIAKRMPGLAVSTTGPGQSEVIIRGVSSRSGKAATVGYYLDEVPISDVSRNVDAVLFDLQRVEVLRGPQGTLYGSSSMGGTIKYVTNEPDLAAFQMRADTTMSSIKGSDGLGYKVNGLVNVPLVEDELALRVLGFHESQQGYVDRYSIDPNDATGIDPAIPPVRGANSADSIGFRVALKYRPIESVELLPSFLYQKLTVDGPFLVDLPPGSLNSNGLVQTRFISEPREDEIKIANLTARIDLGRFELTSSTSYFEREETSREDYSKLGQVLLGGPEVAPTLVPFVQYDHNTSETLLQEVRLSGEIGPFNTVIGAYYSRDRRTTPDFNPIDERFVQVYGNPIDFFGDYEFYNVIFASDPHEELTEIALFGQATYDITERLALTVGLRAFDVKSEFSTRRWGALNGPESFDSGKASSSDVTPKFNLSFQATDDVMVYATAAQGFRTGAAQGGVPEAVCSDDLAGVGLSRSPTGYDPDSVWSYELGWKSRLFDRRVTLNGALYHIDWTEVQQRVELQCGFPFIANFGKAESEGGEVELVWAPTDSLRLSASAGYTDAQLTSTVPGTQGRAGDPLTNVPQWTTSASVDYRHPIAAGMAMFGRAAYSFTDETYRNFNRDNPYRKRPSYELVDVRFGVEAEDERWQVALFVNNLFNEIAQSGLYDSDTGADLPYTRAAGITQPRTFGINAGYRFE